MSRLKYIDTLNIRSSFIQSGAMGSPGSMVHFLDPRAPCASHLFSALDSAAVRGSSGGQFALEPLRFPGRAHGFRLAAGRQLPGSRLCALQLRAQLLRLRRQRGGFLAAAVCIPCVQCLQNGCVFKNG